MVWKRFQLWASRKTLWLSALTVAFALAPMMLSSGSQSWHRDWHYFQHWAHVAQMAFLEGLPPDFNPWHCGGADLAANAQDLSLSPLFVFVLFFGPALGLRIACLVLVVLGSAGMTWSLRSRGSGVLESWFAGSAWGLCVFVHVHISEGHVPFAGFALMPLALGLYSKGLEKLGEMERDRARIYFAASGFVLGNQLLFGGAYSFPFTSMVLALAAAVYLVQERLWSPVLSLGKVYLFALLIGAPKLLPVLELVQRLPRSPLWTDSLTPSLLFDVLFSRQVSTLGVSGHPYDWPEYSLYPGLCVLILAVIGAFVGVPGRSKEGNRAERSGWMIACVLTVFGFWLMLGDISLGLRRWIALLPMVGDLQVPTRYGVVFVLGLVLLGARGVGLMNRSGGWKRAFAGVLVFCSLFELGALDLRWYGEAVEASEASHIQASMPTKAGAMDSAPERMDQAPGLGLVVVNCYEPGPHQIPSALSSGEEEPFLSLSPKTAELQVVRFEPGLMEFEATEALEVVFAQAGSDNWRVAGGKIRPIPGGLLAVSLENGGLLKLQYWNGLRAQGLWIQILALLWFVVTMSREFLRYSSGRRSLPS